MTKKVVNEGNSGKSHFQGNQCAGKNILAKNC